MRAKVVGFLGILPVAEPVYKKLTLDSLFIGKFMYRKLTGDSLLIEKLRS